MQIQLGSDPLVRLEGGLILQVDPKDDVWVYDATQPLDRGTGHDRQLADALRQLVRAAEYVEQCRSPSKAVTLGESGDPVRTDHGMLYIE